jgi:hypothetical protein
LKISFLPRTPIVGIQNNFNKKSFIWLKVARDIFRMEQSIIKEETSDFVHNLSRKIMLKETILDLFG